MNKTILSRLLLCVIFVSFCLTLILCIDTGIFLYQMNHYESDTPNSLPGASIIGVLVSSLVVGGGFLFLEFIIASVGFFSALINRKIASNAVVNRISTVFLSVYSVILISIIGIAVYAVITVV